jgi:hypothetical protein
MDTTGIPEKLAKFERLAQEFHRESDRGCAIMIMCVLEDYLRAMIKALLPDPSAKLGRLAPKGGIGAAIEVAKLLGLLSERQARSFQQLAEIRNKFAHGVMEGVTFDSAEIKRLVDEIEPAVPFPRDTSINSDTPRGWFLVHAGNLCILMLIRTMAIQRLPTAPDFDATEGLPPGFTPNVS